MRGTGSKTLVLDDVFVPYHRAFLREEMQRGHAVNSTARCHTVPLRIASGVLFAAPALGAARGALAAWSTRIGRSEPTGGRLAAAETELARATGDADAAALLLERAARTADQETVTATEAARNPMDCALAVEYLVGAAQRLSRAAGTSGQFIGEPLERFWRDLHFLASHAALRLDTAGVAYGEQLLRGTASPGAAAT
ncbi:hypothetical protein [Micromonospora sp. LOL_023]|uniref:hypothetical protein n=1 Tax=Micromonospora sp. LOL_023 TaxID=3345418 RepID=UPI003A897FC9